VAVQTLPRRSATARRPAIANRAGVGRLSLRGWPAGDDADGRGGRGIGAQGVVV
jgi:hypothetical protein